MTRTPTKVQRLIRLNAFREERADSSLRLAVSEQAQAQEKHASAITDIDRLGEWKVRTEANAALDITVYGVALELEQMAMARAELLHTQLRERECSTQQAKSALTEAACATRVAENRGKRETSLADSVREKRIFDQISDVWLNNRVERND